VRYYYKYCIVLRGILSERPLQISITRRLRDALKKQKRELTYDAFLNNLLEKNTKNPPTDSQHKQNPSTKKGDVI
jgi:hypothetical protein